MKHAIYAVVIVLTLMAFMAHLRAQELGAGELPSAKWLLEQSALAGILAIVLFFYRRDFTERHKEMLQSQKVLLDALQSNTTASVELRSELKTGFEKLERIIKP